MAEPVKSRRQKKVVSKKRQLAKKRPGKEIIYTTAAAVTRLRKRFRMNTSQFARLVCVSPPTVSNWENSSGELNLRQRTLDALALVAELTPAQAVRELKYNR